MQARCQVARGAPAGPRPAGALPAGRSPALPSSSSSSPRRAAFLIARAATSPDGAAPVRVVITGMGLVSCLGHEVDEFYDNLLAGKSGITPITGWDASSYATTFAGEIKDGDAAAEGYVSKKNARRMDAAIKYALTAGKKALRDAGLPHDAKAVPGDGGPIDPARAGILVGTAMGGMSTFATAVEDWATKGFRRMNPFCIPFAITNMPGAQLAMDTGFMGPNYSISTACATGNYCLLAAADHIRRGDADLMLAGGTDAAVIPSGIGGFTACKALSQRNEAPQAASRPWDTGRDGFVMGEGAGVLVLESEAHAKARGATILAEFAGGAVGCDAHHMTEPRPDGSGVAACIVQALKACAVPAAEVDYVNAHATSTPAGDLAEWKAIRSAVPGDRVRINATKSLIGHLLGAASAVEAVAAVQAIRTGWLHPTLNLDSPDPLIDLSVVVGGEKQRHDTRVALSNSFGFGGHNSCVVFKRWEE